MADSTKITKQLKLLAGFADEDDRTITIDNPKLNLTWADIEAFEAASHVLIGDKFGAAFTRYKEAKYVDTTLTTIDVE